MELASLLYSNKNEETTKQLLKPSSSYFLGSERKYRKHAEDVRC